MNDDNEREQHPWASARTPWTVPGAPRDEEPEAPRWTPPPGAPPEAWPPPPSPAGQAWTPPGDWAPPRSPYGSWPASGGAGGWPPPPWTPSPWGPAPYRRPRRGRAGVALAMVVVLAAGLIGVSIGRAIRSPGTSNPSTSSFEPSASPSGAASAIAAKVDRGLVDINTKLGYQRAAAAGTGMVLTSSGEVLTNNHVIDGATTITATVVGTGKTYTAKVVGTDPTADVAVLQLQGASGLTTIPLGDSGSVTPGDQVVAIGNAGGVGGAPSVVTGVVQATGQSITASDQGGGNAERLSDLIETNAPIQPGDSGGPLATSSGKVIGMDTAASAGSRFQAAANVAFAIPINDALSVVHQIESGKASSAVHLGLPGFLGVQVQDAGEGGSTPGALVAGVVSGSPAAQAGIRAGDTITAVDGQSVDAAQTLTTRMQGHHPGDKVTITWVDGNGVTHTATATLGTGPAN